MEEYEICLEPLPRHMRDRGCHEAGVRSCLSCPLPRCLEEMEPNERLEVRSRHLNEKAARQQTYVTVSHLVERNKLIAAAVLD